jgi:hypothetical protein
MAPRLVRVLARYEALRLTKTARLRRTAVTRDICSLRAALHAALNQIDRTAPEVQTVLRRPVTMSQAFGRPTSSPWDKVRTTRAALVESVEVLEALEAIRKPPRGRPRDYRRMWLALTVAMELKNCGVAIRTSRSGKSRGGKFGGVLTAVLNELHGESAPADIFDLIKTAADLSRKPDVDMYLQVLALAEN